MAPIVRRERPGGMRRGVGGCRVVAPDFASYASPTSRSKDKCAELARTPGDTSRWALSHRWTRYANVL